MKPQWKFIGEGATVRPLVRNDNNLGNYNNRRNVNANNEPGNSFGMTHGFFRAILISMKVYDNLFSYVSSFTGILL